MKASEMWRRLRGLIRRREIDEDLRAEMEEHVERLTSEFEAQGMTADEARQAARQRFGNARSLREESRAWWGFPRLESIAQDLRFGARLLRRSPGFTAVAVLTLALGIGANAAVFSWVNALLLRTLPLPQPDRLVNVYLTYLPQAGYDAFRDKASSVDLAGFYFRGLNLSGRGEAARLSGAGVSSNFFSVLGVGAERGRTLEQGDSSPGRERVAVLSDTLWRTRFAGDPNIVGRAIELDGAEYQVIGVMPAGFYFPDRQVEVWVPLREGNPELWGTWVHMIGRLRPGATLAQANAELRALVPQVVALFPWGMPHGWGSWLAAMPIEQWLTGDFRNTLLLLLGAVGMVLLIACVNVANLLLARGAGREREIAVRTALGAARSRIARQLVTESVLLAALGGVAGLALARLGMGLLGGIVPENEVPAGGVTLDWRVVGFAAAIAVVTGVAFGAVPALRARRVDIERALKATGRSSMSRERRRVSAGLVVAETSLAVVLVIGGAMLGRSLWELAHQRTGFNPDGLVTASLTPSQTLCPPGFGNQRSDTSAGCHAFYDEVLAKARALPGVESATYSDIVPYGDLRNTVLAVDGNPQYTANSPYQLFEFSVSPSYFQTMEIPLLRGRTFRGQDVTKAPAVVILSRNAAEQMWPGQDPIGKRVRPSWMDEWRTVVGVVSDVKVFSVAPGAWAYEGGGAVYFPDTQGLVSAPTDLKLVVRTAQPASIAAALPGMVAQVNATVPVTKVQTMPQIISESMAAPRTTTWLLVAFAGMALLLGAIGLYGLVSYSVAARTQEIGIRMALGASRGEMWRRVVLEALSLSAFGVALGVAGAVALARVLQSSVYGIGKVDAATVAVVGTVLIAVALAAAFVPARRAASVDPMTALRYE